MLIAPERPPLPDTGPGELYADGPFPGGPHVDGLYPTEPPWSEPPGGWGDDSSWGGGDGWPPGYIGWAGPPMGELAFDLFDLAGPGGVVPAPGGVDPSSLPPPVEPLLSAVLGVAAMGDDDCLDVMATASRSIARWQGVLVHALARFAALRPPDEPVDRAGGTRDYSMFAEDEIAPVLAISPTAASHRLADAYTLAGRLPGTLEALETGRVDYGRAMAMVELTGPLSGDQARQVEDAVLAKGGRRNHSAFRQATRRAVLKADPEAAERRRQAAKADRRVYTRPLDDGTAELSVVLPAELIQAIYQRITELARIAATATDPRTMDQLRADAAAALLLGTGHEHMNVEVHVTVPATTLLGLLDEPGELEGYGPIPAGVARELAENATWRRIVTDPVDGTVLDVGRRRYPSAGLARHVRERDRTCRFPGCARTARQADLDHTQRHVDGGTTHDGQLSCLCRHHHRLKDEEWTGWSLAQPAPGHLEWMSPTGRVYKVGPTPADQDPPHAPGRPRPGRSGSRAATGTTGSRSPGAARPSPCPPDTTRQIASRSGGSPGDPPPF